MKNTYSFSWGSQRPGLFQSPCQPLPKPGSDHSTWMCGAVEPAAVTSPTPAVQDFGPSAMSLPRRWLPDLPQCPPPPTPQVWPPLPLGSWLLPSPVFARAWESSAAMAANYSASPFICWLGSLDFVICYAEVFFLTNLFTRFNSSIMFSF